MDFLLAWRNIWRNPRRTAVILSAVVIGVWSMVFMGAVMRGMAVDMIHNGISTLTGHLQIHHKDYSDDPVIENSMTDLPALDEALKNGLPKGSRWAERIRVEAVAGNARHTTNVILVGIDPPKEKDVSFIGQAVRQGRYLKTGDSHEILVGKALVEEFETRLGHKLILSAPDINGEIMSRAFHIAGVYRAQMQETEKQYVFVPIEDTRKMLKLKNAISEVSVVLPDDADPSDVKRDLEKALGGSSFEIKTWQESLPVLMAYLQIFNGFIYVWYLVIFVAMALGIVNTTLMAVFERMREFGLVKALGVRPKRLIRMILTESVYLLLIGSAVGNAIGLLSVYALSKHGINFSNLAEGTDFIGVSRIVYPVLDIRDLLAANLVVLLLGLLVSLYPASKAARFTPVKALSHT